MKLEIKHLAPYLPYGLQVVLEDKTVSILGVEHDNTLKNIHISKVLYGYANCKPILRPLSDLTKEIEHNGDKFVPIELLGFGRDKCLAMDLFFKDDLDYLPYNLFIRLIQWHFDVFGLIDKGLAVDINTL